MFDQAWLLDSAGVVIGLVLGYFLGRSNKNHEPFANAKDVVHKAHTLDGFPICFDNKKQLRSDWKAEYHMDLVTCNDCKEKFYES